MKKSTLCQSYLYLRRDKPPRQCENIALSPSLLEKSILICRSIHCILFSMQLLFLPDTMRLKNDFSGAAILRSSLDIANGLPWPLSPPVQELYQGTELLWCQQQCQISVTAVFTQVLECCLEKSDGGFSATALCCGVLQVLSS